MTRIGVLAVAAATVLTIAARQRETPTIQDREVLHRLNNLGVALLERYEFEASAAKFREALALDPRFALAQTNLAIALHYVPDLAAARREAEAALAIVPNAPQPHYLLGLIARAENRPADAEKAFVRVLAIDARDLGANFMLGQVQLQQRRLDEAIAHLRAAVDAEPFNASAAYALGQALIRVDRRDEAAKWLERFQQLRQSTYQTTFGQNYLEQGRYAEALASTGAEADLADPRTPAVTFAAAPLAAPAAFPAVPAPGRVSVVLADLDADDWPDVLAARDGRALVWPSRQGRFDEPRLIPSPPGATAALAADYDNDGRRDVLVLGSAGLTLLHNDGNLVFTDASRSAGLPGFPGLPLTAAFTDLDHDGDLDLVVAGVAAPSSADTAGAVSPLVLRNNGNGTFADITASAALASPHRTLAVVPTDYDNRRDVDLVFADAETGPRLLRNLRDGRFEDVTAFARLHTGEPLLSTAAGDINKDGYTDLFLGGPAASTLALSNGRGQFDVAVAPAATAGARAAMLLDYDLDGLLDLFVATPDGLRLHRSIGRGWTDVSEAALGEIAHGHTATAAIAAGDLDRDGDLDVVLAGSSALSVLRNDGGNRHRSLAVRSAGRVTNRFGVGNTIETRAGSLYTKLEITTAVPASAPADVIVGIGPRLSADVVRTLWVSGILQAETDLPAPVPGRATALTITELDRKPSSCPYLFTWNGERFELISDFLGGGETGYYLAPGVRSEPDPVEYVRIRGDQLEPVDGRLELRVTHELEEVLYLDHLELVALDHPADVEIFPNEGMTTPPKRHVVHAVRDVRAVTAAFDDRGRDVTDALHAVDRRFVEGFALLPLRGYASEHALTLDLSGLPPGHTRLLLTGWTDYAFSSDNVAASQRGLVLHPPVIQVERADGSWETVVEDVGVPVGRPQTIVVDLGGRWRGPGRRVRIVTTMRVYWDRVAVAAEASADAVRSTRLALAGAELSERGFSAELRPDGRDPLMFDYHRTAGGAPWKVAPGRYTRVGDVRELLAEGDDLFVVAKPGDEIAVSFNARGLGSRTGGRQTTFLLRADGFSKEMDINSASPDVVQPLPYHGMRRYPYGPDEAPALVREQALRAERFNTRIVARPMPSLALPEP